MSGRPKLADALDLEDVWLPIPRIRAPIAFQGMTEPCTWGSEAAFSRRVFPVGRRGRHDRRFRPGHAGLVEEDLRAPEPARELQAVIRVVQGDPSAELAKREEMGVEAPAPDLVAARPG